MIHSLANFTLAVVVVVVVPVFSMLGCPPARDKPNGVTSFEVFDVASGWYLRVAQDGSGSVGYGSSGGDVALLPQGTYDFTVAQEAFLASARPEPGNGGTTTDTRPLVVSVTKDDGSALRMYTRDRAGYTSLVRQGIEASQSDRLRTIWAEKPIGGR